MNRSVSRPVLLWAFFLLPALGVSLWLALWLQWYLPGEDLWGADVAIASVMLSGAVAGLGSQATPRPWRVAWAAMPALAIVPEHIAWYELVPFATSKRPDLVVPVLRLSVLMVPLMAGAFAGWRWPGRWRLPLTSALACVFLTSQFFVREADRKSFWPWSAHQQELLRLRDDATAAARRLGLPPGRMLDDGQLKRLGEEVPIERTFVFPLIRRHVTARILDSGTESVWIYFGDGRFGPLDTRTMFLAWVDD